MFKKLILLVLIMFCVVSFAYASEITEFSDENIDQHVGEPNEHHHHPFTVTRDDDPILGAGLILFSTKARKKDLRLLQNIDMTR